MLSAIVSMGSSVSCCLKEQQLQPLDKKLKKTTSVIAVRLMAILYLQSLDLSLSLRSI